MSQHATEDLLLRARRGELGDDEARRFEVAVGSSRELELLFEAGAEFDAQAELLPGDEERMRALVTGVLQKLGRVEPSRAAASARVASRRSSSAWLLATSMGFGMLLSVALASAWQAAERRHWWGDAAPPSRPALAAAAHSTLPLANPPTAAAEPSLARTPALRTAVPVIAKPARRAVATESAPANSGSVGIPLLVPAPLPATPRELFVRANEARREGAREAALALYEELIARYPTSVEAEDARLLVGNLRLSQRAASAALGEFERYGSGALTPEALWGKARALRSLQSPDERAVLERIVREYPQSPYANAARQRLLQRAP
jgi:TolA-binding protein